MESETLTLIEWEVVEGYLVPVLKTNRNRQLAKRISYLVFVELAKQQRFKIENLTSYFSSQRDKGFAVNYLRKLRAYGFVKKRGDEYEVMPVALPLFYVVNRLDELRAELYNIDRIINEAINKVRRGFK